MNRFRLAAVTLTSTLLVPTVCLAREITVDLTGAGDHTDIQSAIDAAQDGDVILVRPGVYETEESISFNGKAITVRGGMGAEETTVRNATPRPEDFFDVPVYVFVFVFESGEGEGSVLEGISITSANEVFSGGVSVSANSSPTLKDCIIRGNRGSGVRSSEGSSPTLIRCTITGNAWNTSAFESSGGGLRCEGFSSPVLIACTISGNAAASGGGVYGEDSSPMLLNCLITGNCCFRDRGGGGLYFLRSTPVLINCTISGNQSRSLPPDRVVTHPAGGLIAAQSSPVLRNCILWGNITDGNLRKNIEIIGETSRPEMTYSLIEDGEGWPGDGNTSDPPLFMSPGVFDFTRTTDGMPDFIVDAGDYRLQPGSAAIDAGTLEGAPLFDADENGRPCDGGVDMGAYESGACEAQSHPDSVRALRARFTVVPDEGLPELEVQVDASSSSTHEGSSIVSYEWDFGDGARDTGITASHTYSRHGCFTVRLTIEDDRGRRALAGRDVAVLFRSEDVSPWNSVEIGGPASCGGASGSRFEDECLLVQSFEGNIDSSGEDRLHFVYQELTGDFTITAQVSRVGAAEPHDSDAFGLMLRESLEPGSRHASLLFSGLDEYPRLIYRRPGRSGRTSVRSPGTWLRIARRGNLVVGSTSTDGVEWSDGVEPRDGFTLPQTVLGGVAVAGPERNEASVSFCDLEVRGTGAPFRRGDCNADGQLNIADGVSNLRHLFAGGAEPPCLDAADTDDSGALEIADSISTFNYLFHGDKIPPMPGPWQCGPDPTVDELGCEEFSACR